MAAALQMTLDRFPDRFRRWSSPVRRYLDRCVRIDSRALAGFRVFAALLIVADLLLRSRNFTYFYTDDGVVPRSLVLELTSGPSIFHLTTSTTLIAALFVLHGLVAVQLLVGYRTRLATVLCVAFVVSLDHHNPFVLSYADTLFRLLLFWAIFLPLGERWSIDALRRDRAPRESVASIATALILGQMVFMYVSNGLIKSQSDVWGTGDAAPLVMGIDEMTFLFGDFVRQFPTLLSYGGLTWYYLLLVSPLLLLLPGRKRLPLVAMFVGGHLSFALTVRIGAFAYVALLGLLLFVQTPVWADGTRLLAAANIDPGAISTRASEIATRWLDRAGALRSHLPLHSGVPTASGLVGTDRMDRLRTHTYNAVLGTVVVTILLVSAIALVGVAGALLDGSEEGATTAEEVEAALDRTMDRPGVAQVETVATRFGIDQPLGWGVFAGPDPRTTDRYYVFTAETTAGETVDVYNDRPATFDRPNQALQTQHGTYRERFYMNSVRRGGFTGSVPKRLAEWYCEHWTSEEGEVLVWIHMSTVEEEITHDTIDTPDERERTETLFHRHTCTRP